MRRVETKLERVCGIDWNTARVRTPKEPGEWRAAFISRVLHPRRRARLGRVHAGELPAGGADVPQKGSAPYENDHVFTDAATHTRLASTEVVYRIDGQDAVALRHHAPVIADFG
jgi:hypothetical protein